MANFTARTLYLTISQRVGLENLLGEKGPTKRDGATVYWKIRKKVKLSMEEKKDLAKRGVILARGAEFLIDEEQASSLPPTPVWLESEEVRKLHKWGEDLDHPNMVAVMDWLEPLMEQLEGPAKSRLEVVGEGVDEGLTTDLNGTVVNA